MKKLPVLNIKGEKVSTINLEEKVWGIEPNDAVLYDALTLTRNNQKQGTSDTKTRDEVSGGGRKPWKQKGTGRARHGSTRSPIWRSGGVTFGPHPGNVMKKMNRKERRIALRSALSYKLIDSELIIVDNFIVETSKTKEMIKLLKTLNIEKNVLIVVEELDENLILATRNLRNVMLLSVDEVNTLDIVCSNNMIITQGAIKKLEEVLV